MEQPTFCPTDVSQRARKLLASTWVASTLGLAAVVAFFTPDAAANLQFDRTAIAAGEVWRLITGNIVHWTADHLFWDTLMFVVLGAAIETRSRRVFVAAAALSALAVSITVWMGTSLPTYRGLSGIDSALFVLLAAWHLTDFLRSRSYKLAAVPICLLAGFIGKVGYEVVTGQTYFVDSSAGAFIPLPQVHLAGAAAGLAVLMIATRGTKKKVHPRGLEPLTFGSVDRCSIQLS